MSVGRWALVLCATCAINAAVTWSAPSVAPVCLNGASDSAGKCVCNRGFSDFQGNCFLTADTRSNICPLGSTMRDGFCHFLPLPPIRDVVPAQEKTIVVPPLRITIPLPELPEPERENGEVYEPNGDGDDEKPHDVKLGFEKYVNNRNVINNETSVHTVNENNVVIHLVRKLPSGAIRTEIVRNNVTTVYDEEDPQDAEDTTSPDELPTVTTEMVPEKPRCCKIVSPRVCQKQADEWVCFHRKQYVCSNVCTADEMYLRPRRITYRKPWLIMPPGTNRTTESCFLGRCPKPDCSGCLRGRRGCHAMCYTYDCAVDNSCHFLDWDMICRDDLTQVCTLLEEKIIRNRQPVQAVTLGTP